MITAKMHIYIVGKGVVLCKIFVVADYLELLDSQREAIFTEIKGIETDLLWQRPAEKNGP